MQHSFHDRRGKTRPSNGDTTACPSCARGTREFSERTRDAASGHTCPAWACDACGAIHPVRRAETPAASSEALRYSAKRLRAHSMRTLMKSRTARIKANSILQKSATRKKPKAS
jgi:hypothetical protein